jgi:ATP-dependent DNA helicase RecG
MKSSRLSTTNLSWDSSLDTVVGGSKRITPTIEKLNKAGIQTLNDLLWVLPLRLFKTPALSAFSSGQIEHYLRGEGRIVRKAINPAFGRKRPGRPLLYNGFIIIKDDHSNELLTLRWFNLYPNQKKQIESLEHIKFLGLLQEYKGQSQIINPKILLVDETEDYIIEYPTVNKVPGSSLEKFFKLIPSHLWQQIPQVVPELGYDEKITLGEAFKIIHGQLDPEKFHPDLKNQAEERLVYEEFLIEQLKIKTRRKYIKRKSAHSHIISSPELQQLKAALPFVLTGDQEKVLVETLKDLSAGHPMMRIVQGDVGCGKTILAYLAARVVIFSGQQVALMCPTEALAQQHLKTFKELGADISVDILLGSTKAKEKKEVIARLKNGEISIIIGTHSLFQDSVIFKNLGLAIIDEQHKFGVEQRLKLVAKGAATHCLIMTATPIPRTLSLAQYGDLDISTIRTMPSGRKGIKTRITVSANYQKYLEFVRSRLTGGEQAYFVFPAIDESETIDLQNVKESFKKYQAIFREFKVEMLHGQMSVEEKEKVIGDFSDGKIHILISTSVIEVGINIPNSTIMSIYNPERFGLSSLHQLRGRVGRGDKPGFCFLVVDKELDPRSHQRLEVIEKNLDGFIIAEEDLKFRGEGDIFGVDQSGSISSKKVASYLVHSRILEQVIQNLDELMEKKPQAVEEIIEKLAKDQKILDTI